MEVIFHPQEQQVHPMPPLGELSTAKCGACLGEAAAESSFCQGRVSETEDS